MGFNRNQDLADAHTLPGSTCSFTVHARPVAGTALRAARYKRKNVTSKVPPKRSGLALGLRFRVSQYSIKRLEWQSKAGPI